MDVLPLDVLSTVILAKGRHRTPLKKPFDTCSLHKQHAIEFATQTWFLTWGTKHPTFQNGFFTILYKCHTIEDQLKNIICGSSSKYHPPVGLKPVLFKVDTVDTWDSSNWGVRGRLYSTPEYVSYDLLNLVLRRNLFTYICLHIEFVFV